MPPQNPPPADPAPTTTSSDSPPPPEARMRVAVVGGGVSGLSAAWHLAINCSTTHDVTLFEGEGRAGGHARTVPVKVGGDGGEGCGEEVEVDVDVGFMVFNRENYPNMVRWFEALSEGGGGGDGGGEGEGEGGAALEEDSDMSLSVSLTAGCGPRPRRRVIEWSSDGLSGLLAHPPQSLMPSFYGFLRDLVRFNSSAPSLLRLSEYDPRRAATTGQYLRDEGYGEAFCAYYLLPMMAALWSASVEEVLDFPAEQLVGFLCNHRMLQIWDRPQWKTVAGRSRRYTERVLSVLGEDRVRLSAPILSVERSSPPDASAPIYELFTTGGESAGTYDRVIFAAHPPDVARMLSSSSSDSSGAPPELLGLLSSIEYADNAVYVHSDPRLMPRGRAAWASWNCIGRSDLLWGAASRVSGGAGSAREAMEGGGSGFGGSVEDGEGGEELEGPGGRMRAVHVTYWLNRLQNLECEEDVFVSLNPHSKPDPNKTHGRFIMAHPQFTPATLRARRAIQERFQGRDGLWFCGAWGGYGFHEDGCRGGFEAAAELSGVPLPWAGQSGGGGDGDGDGAKEKAGREGKGGRGGAAMVLPPPDLSSSAPPRGVLGRLYSLFRTVHRILSYDIPVAVCRRFIVSFLRSAVRRGTLRLRLTDGSVVSFGDGRKVGPCADDSPVTVRVFDDWFFVRTALEYDLGLARSYMSGHFAVEPLPVPSLYDPVIRPPPSRDESNVVLGDPVGLTRLFLLFIANRDDPDPNSRPARSARMHAHGNALANASGLLISKLGSLLNFVRYRLSMDNSEGGGSRRNIRAHYDLSNHLFVSFLDEEERVYSSAIYDAVAAPSPRSGMVFRGTLEEAQLRKLDTLLDRAQVRPGQTLLDVGFGWGGLCIRAAKRFGCRVCGVTLSVEQMASASDRVREEGLEHLITFEVVDYRTFARRGENRGRFDRVISCEMIEGVGHDHLGEFFWAVEQVLAHDGVLVMEAITTPEARYENYRRSTDLINTIIFPGSCCPSLHALVDASYRHSRLTLERVDNIAPHYAETLREWRRRFNANEALVRRLGFDDSFMRIWNYYLTYCEAGFHSRTENCLVLVFTRPGCRALSPLSETRSVTQRPALTEGEAEGWLAEGG